MNKFITKKDKTFQVYLLHPNNETCHKKSRILQIFFNFVQDQIASPSSRQILISNVFSPLTPSALSRLPCTGDTSYRPHLQSIYLWWPPDDRGSVCPKYSRPYLWVTVQCQHSCHVCKCEAVLWLIVGMEVQRHSFISFGIARTVTRHCYW
jgi:hypothetical protein